MRDAVEFYAANDVSQTRVRLLLFGIRQNVLCINVSNLNMASSAFRSFVARALGTSSALSDELVSLAMKVCQGHGAQYT